MQASDIHIIPRKREYIVKLRLQGVLFEHQKLPPIAGERLISHLKFMSSMDISEKRKPQSGSWQVNHPSYCAALRISTLPSTLSKESLVIRIFPKNHTLTLDSISLFPKCIPELTSMVAHSHGMIIFTGPTGSGKTTTIYSLAEHSANNLQRNIITLEDPVERQHDAFLQMQVNEKAGITYHSGLKAILRHDPDMIFVGEIRDAETAKIAVRASMTGHLVLTSMHTRDTKGAIFRLLEFGVNELEIEQTLIGVVAQRLVSLTCPFCKDGCTKLCGLYSKSRRAAVFELLKGGDLRQFLASVRFGETAFSPQRESLAELIRKGIALGYIAHEEYCRWIYEEEGST